MSVVLESLLLEFGADFSQFEKDIQTAVSRSRGAAVQIEKNLKLKLPELNLSPTVNHKPLTELNKHIESKRTHVKEVQAWLNNNPLIVKTKHVSTQSNSGGIGASHSSASSQSSSTDFFKAVEKFAKAVDKMPRSRGLLGGLANGLSFAFGNSLFDSVGKQLKLSVEDALAPLIGSFELVGKKSRENLVASVTKFASALVPDPTTTRQLVKSPKLVAKFRDRAYEAILQAPTDARKDLQDVKQQRILNDRKRLPLRKKRQELKQKLSTASPEDSAAIDRELQETEKLYRSYLTSARDLSSARIKVTKQKNRAIATSKAVKAGDQKPIENYIKVLQEEEIASADAAYEQTQMLKEALQNSIGKENITTEKYARSGNKRAKSRKSRKIARDELAEQQTETGRELYQGVSKRTEMKARAAKVFTPEAQEAAAISKKQMRQLVEVKKRKLHLEATKKTETPEYKSLDLKEQLLLVSLGKIHKEFGDINQSVTEYISEMAQISNSISAAKLRMETELKAQKQMSAPFVSQTLDDLIKEANGGEDLPEHLKPEVVENNDFLKKLGAVGTYLPDANIILVTTGLLEKLRNDITLTEKEYEDMRHELHHGAQIGFGSGEGRDIVEQGGLAVQENSGTEEELSRVAPYLERYAPEERRAEQDAYIEGYRSKDDYQAYLKRREGSYRPERDGENAEAGREILAGVQKKANTLKQNILADTNLAAENATNFINILDKISRAVTELTAGLNAGLSFTDVKKEIQKATDNLQQLKELHQPIQSDETGGESFVTSFKTAHDRATAQENEGTSEAALVPLQPAKELETVAALSQSALAKKEAGGLVRQTKSFLQAVGGQIKKAEEFALNITPAGHTIKNGVQLFGVPALGYAALQSTPVGAAVADTASNLIGGGLNPIVSAGGNALKETMSTGIHNNLGSLPFIGGQVADGLTTLTTQGVDTVLGAVEKGTTAGLTVLATGSVAIASGKAAAKTTFKTVFDQANKIKTRLQEAYHNARDGKNGAGAKHAADMADTISKMSGTALSDVQQLIDQVKESEVADDVKKEAINTLNEVKRRVGQIIADAKDVAKTARANAQKRASALQLPETRDFIDVMASPVADAWADDVPETEPKEKADVRDVSAGRERLKQELDHFRALRDSLDNTSGAELESKATELTALGEAYRISLTNWDSELIKRGIDPQISSELKKEMSAFRGVITRGIKKGKNKLNEASTKIDDGLDGLNIQKSLDLDSLKKNAAAMSSTFRQISKSWDKAAKTIAGADPESTGLDTLKQVAKNPRNQKIAKDLAVNTAGYAASKVGDQQGVVASLAGDFSGAVAARAVIEGLTALAAAYQQVSADPAFEAMAAFDKLSTVAAMFTTELGKANAELKEGFSGDVFGFAIGNAAAQITDHAIPGVGAVTALGTVPHAQKMMEMFDQSDNAGLRIQKSIDLEHEFPDPWANGGATASVAKVKKQVKQTAAQMKQDAAVVKEISQDLAAGISQVGNRVQTAEAYLEARLKAIEQDAFVDARIETYKSVTPKPAHPPSKDIANDRVKNIWKGASLATSRNARNISASEPNNIASAVQKELAYYKAKISTFVKDNVDSATAAIQAGRIPPQIIGRIKAARHNADLTTTQMIDSTNDLTDQMGDLTAKAEHLADNPPEDNPIKSTLTDIASGDAIKKWSANILELWGSITQTIPALQNFSTNLIGLGKVALVGTVLFLGTQQLFNFGKEALTVANNVRMLTSVLGNGSLARGAKELERIQESASTKGTPLLSTLKAASGFKAASTGTALEEQSTDIVLSVNELATSRGLNTQTIDRVNAAIVQMASKGRISLEELTQQLGEALPGALQMSAKAMGTTQAEFIKMVENGDVLANDLLPKLAQQMRQAAQFQGIDPSQNLTAQLARVQNAGQMVQIAFGSALLPVVTPVMSVIADWLSTIASNAHLVTLAAEVMGGALLVTLLTATQASGVFGASLVKIRTLITNGIVTSLKYLGSALVSLLPAMAFTAAFVAAFEFVKWYTGKGTASLVESTDATRKSVDALADAYRRVNKAAGEKPKPIGSPKATGFGGFVDGVDDWFSKVGLRPRAVNRARRENERKSRANGGMPTFGDVEQAKNVKLAKQSTKDIQNVLDNPVGNKMYDSKAIQAYISNASALEIQIKNLNADLLLLQTLSDKPDGAKIKAIQDQLAALQKQRLSVDDNFNPGGVAALEAYRDSLAQEIKTYQELIDSSGQEGLKPDLETRQIQLDAVNAKIERMAQLAKLVANNFQSIRIPLIDNKAQRLNQDETLSINENKAKVTLAGLKAGYANPAEGQLKQAQLDEIGATERLKILEKFVTKQKSILAQAAPDAKRSVEALLGTSLESAGIGDITKAQELMKAGDFPEEVTRIIGAMSDLNSAQTEASAGQVTLAESTLGTITAYREWQRSLMGTKDALDAIASAQQGTDFNVNLSATNIKTGIEQQKLGGNLTEADYERLTTEVQADELNTRIANLKLFAQAKLGITSTLSKSENALLRQSLNSNPETASLQQILIAKKRLEIFGRNNAVSGNVVAALDGLEGRQQTIQEIADASGELARVDLSSYVRKLEDVRNAITLLDGAFKAANFEIDLSTAVSRTNIKRQQLEQGLSSVDAERNLTQVQVGELGKRLVEVQSHFDKRLAIVRAGTASERKELEALLGGSFETASMAQIQTAKARAAEQDKISPVNANVVASLDALEANQSDRLEVAKLNEQVIDAKLQNTVEISYQQIRDIAKSFQESMRNLNESYKDYLESLSDQIEDTAEEVSKLATQIDVLDIKLSLKRALEVGTEGIIGAFVNKLSGFFDQMSGMDDNTTQAQRAVRQVKKDGSRRLRDFNKQYTDSVKSTQEQINQAAGVTVGGAIRLQKGDANNTSTIADLVNQQIAAGTSIVNSIQPQIKAAQPAQNNKDQRTQLWSLYNGIQALDATIKTQSQSYKTSLVAYQQTPNKTAVAYKSVMSQYDSLRANQFERKRLNDGYGAARAQVAAGKTAQIPTTSIIPQTAVLSVAVKYDTTEAEKLGNALVAEKQKLADMTPEQKAKQREIATRDLDDGLAVDLKNIQKDIKSRNKQLVDVRNQLVDLQDTYGFETPDRMRAKTQRDVGGQFDSIVESATQAQEEIDAAIANGATAMEAATQAFQAEGIDPATKAVILERISAMGGSLLEQTEAYNLIKVELQKQTAIASQQKLDAQAFADAKLVKQQGLDRDRFLGDTQSNLLSAEAGRSGLTEYESAAIEGRAAQIQQMLSFNEEMAGLDEKLMKLGITAPEEIGKIKDSFMQLNELKLDKISEQADALGSEIRSGLQSALSDSLASFFKAETTLGESLANFGKSILTMFADIAAKIATQKIMNGLSGLFGGVGGGTGIGSNNVPTGNKGLLGGLLGGILNFKEGGAVGDVPEIANFATGGGVGAMSSPEAMRLGLGVRAAMDREGNGAVPIVASKGEWVLNANDTKLFMAMQKSGAWIDAANDVGNYANGGAVGSPTLVGARANSNTTSDRRTIITNTFNVSSPDADSFRRSQSQIQSDSDIRTRRSASRNT